MCEYVCVCVKERKENKATENLMSSLGFLFWEMEFNFGSNLSFNQAHLNFEKMRPMCETENYTLLRNWVIVVLGGKGRKKKHNTM